MARMHETILTWGNKHDGPNNYKHNRRGAAEDAFWDEDELVEFRRPSKKKRPRKKPGCIGNDGKSHVYVWEQRRERSSYSGNIYEYEVSLCCGCLKRQPRRGYRNWRTIK